MIPNAVNFGPSGILTNIAQNPDQCLPVCQTLRSYRRYEIVLVEAQGFLNDK